MATDFTIDWPLTTQAFGNRQSVSKFVVARGVLPAVWAAKKSATYRTYGDENAQAEDSSAALALGAEYPRRSLGSSTATYNCLKYGEELLVTEEDLEDADDPAIVEENHARSAMALSLGKAEKLVQTLFQTAGNYGSNTASATTLSGAKWDATGADVRKAFHVAKESVLLNSYNSDGMVFAICNMQVLHAMLRAGNITDQFQPTLNRVPTNPELASYFGLDGLIIADAAYNSAAYGQDATAAWRWNENVAVFKVPDGTGEAGAQSDRIESCFMKTFSWMPSSARQSVEQVGANFALPVIETYNEKRTDSRVVRSRMYFDAELVDAGAGYLITDPLT